MAAVASSCRVGTGGSGHAVLPRADRRDRAGPGARRAAAERGGGRQGRGRRAGSCGRRGGRGNGLAAVGEPALRRRRAASALALSLVPILALAVYGAYGSPQSAGQPVRRRAAARRTTSISRRPSRRSRRISPRTRRTAAAGRSSRRSISAWAGWTMRSRPTRRPCGSSAPDADRLANYGEVLVIAKDGLVPAEAQAAFEKARQARCRLAQGALLSRPRGRAGRAASTRRRRTIRRSCRPLRADAPWVPMRARSNWPASTRRRGSRQRRRPGSAEAIAGMVEGLASRLEAQGGTRRGMGAADALLCGARAARQGAAPQPRRAGRPWRRSSRPADHRHDGPGTANSTDARRHDPQAAPPDA